MPLFSLSSHPQFCDSAAADHGKEGELWKDFRADGFSKSYSCSEADITALLRALTHGELDGLVRQKLLYSELFQKKLDRVNR